MSYDYTDWTNPNNVYDATSLLDYYERTGRGCGQNPQLARLALALSLAHFFTKLSYMRDT